MGGDVIERILAWAATDPTLPAVVEGGVAVSYGELVARAWGLAGELARFGAHPKVAVLLPQGADAYAAMIASLLAGGTYLPCNTASVAAKIEAVIGRFGPDVLVAGPEQTAGLALPPGLPVLHKVPPRDGMPQIRAPHRLAYVIFTSGSTGMPKGVMIPRAALNHYVDWALAAMRPGPGDRWSQHPNISFDLSVLDIFGALCSGAALYPLRSESERMLPARFIAAHRLTIWNSVPSVVDMMSKARELTPERLASLRLLTFCGEALHTAQVEALFQAAPQAVIHNTYGPTECTVSCTELRLTAERFRHACDDTVALGTAIDGMRLHLLDGEQGTELAISGPQLADGYWEDEARTRDAFITLEEEGEAIRAYRTGDMVRMRDGQLFFARRKDTQVKIRGYRLELDEVNSALRGLGFAEAATVLVEGRLHAFVGAPPPLDESKLRHELGRRLDPHAVPERIHRLDQLPRNANDKIDLGALAGLVTLAEGGVDHRS
ncbi:hypothetical protein A6A04_01855 [Paramagnetospirillum marisnigri]|uniref:AMP-dependent synthetase/ligase domain-containing protein n=1 Tax=Paramagnetospirillum marisnigri TaxID=1285242 RepID=A0A178MNC6_9PROT|nr:AMP-binding protein [Paramagnetospirillum marisnigri]OAN50179.1 hypothetical protein A6A04_01855 [Paramagnetospirillum marisnigri]